MSKEKKLTFEAALNRLEEIARLLESGEAPLEESLALYEEGMKLIEFCNTKLNEAAKKVQKLTRNSEGEFQTEPLDSAESPSSDTES
ncbi:MAG TPA: exodeoxyribonuclease VII small subunit [Calditrichae bacterium]|nr:exodeoxyribonuclease VII small subunit [Calditrichia bacterium]